MSKIKTVIVIALMVLALAIPVLAKTPRVQQTPRAQQTPPPAKPTNCSPSYPDVCIPPPPPDLNCPDIPHQNFRVLPPDPHRFDGDKDGIGCESKRRR